MRHLSDIKPGQVIGRYEILSPIARGGMAAVWVARQRGSRGFSKVVAVKTMLPTISDDPRFEKMFLDEAQIASRIRHSNVVEILDLGEEDAILYLVMEWVDGESLSALRRQAAEGNGIPLRLALRVVADVCAGLHAAHELVDNDGRPFGLVHRDVSPQNILVGYNGDVKIVDFGVAKVAGRTTDTTSIGHARGKPPYMAPEQVFGREIDRRADIFALGIILYQLLAGRHPFRGENDIATLHNIISDQVVVPPSAVAPSIPPAVDAATLRALERDPRRRFGTAYEFELALEAVLDSELGRVRVEEVRTLMSETFGAAGEERRSIIRDAIRRADCEEPTCLDVRLGVPIAASSPDSGADSPIRSTGKLGVSTSVSALSFPDAAVVEAGDAFVELEDTVVEEPFGQLDRASATGAARSLNSRIVTFLVLAMLAGAAAAAAWLVLSIPTRAPKPASRGMASIVSPSPVSSTPAGLREALPEPPRMRSDEPPVSSTSASGETREQHRPVGQRRVRATGTGSVAGGGGKGNLYSGLPPVPQPGF
jgi:eukaryotic-like serine/threonine-protein kinase